MRRLAALLLALGCAGSGVATNVFSIGIGASSGGPLLITSLGGTMQLSAVPRDSSGRAVAGVAVAWVSSDTGVATVSATGLVTAVANGKADITASGGNATGRVTVTVAQAPGSIAVNPPSAGVERNASVQFTASVVDALGNAVTDAQVTWSSADASIATVSAAGLATGVAAGSTDIVATSGDESAHATLTVTVPAAAAVAVTSAQTGPMTSVGDTRQLTAAATDATGAPLPEAAFDWSSSDDTVVSVDAHGVVTAVKNGTATITATSGGVHGSLDVTVAQAVHALAISPQAQSIAPGADFTFAAHPLDANGHPVAGAAAAAWSIDDASVATINADTGAVHGNDGALVSASTTVRAAIGAAHDSATLTVDPAMAPVTSLSLSQDAATLVSFDETVQLTASPKNAAGNPVPGVHVDWSSDHPAVASVDGSGLVTALANGTAVVTASGGGKSATATITVQQSVVEVVIAPPSTATLVSFDETLQLSASANDANHHAVAGAAITWDTADHAVITVSNAGLVTAVANGGPIDVTATSGAFHDSVAVSVAQAVHAVNLSPPGDSVPPSSTIDFSAAAVDANGHLVEGAPAATWQTSDTTNTSVSSTGHVVVGAAPDETVTITATISGVDGTAQLVIDSSLAPVDHVVITGGDVSLSSIGDTVPLSAQAQDAANDPLARAITWSIQDGSSDVVTVSSAGLVTARGNGTKTVVASSGGVSGTTSIAVSQVVASVSVSTAVNGASATLASLGQTLALQATGFDARSNRIAGGSFTWQSDSAHATVDAATGAVTAVSNGGANIFAKAANDVESPAFAVTVAQAVDHVAVDAGGALTTLASIGDTVQLTAHAFDALDNAMAATFAWSPATGAAAIVDPGGLVTAAFNGATSIQATAGGKTGSLTVTVQQALVTIAVSGTATLTSIDQTAQLTATGKDARQNAIPGGSFTWSGGNSFVSLTAAGVVKALANGSADVVASSGAVSSPPFTVTVAQAVASVNVTGAASIGAIEGTTQLAASALDANSHAVSGVTFAWSIQDGSTNVVTVDSGSGLVTAVAPGQKSVVASGGGKSGSLVVTVQQVPASVTVSGASSTLSDIGATLALTAAAADANGHAISGATFTWRSDDTAVATVSAAGVVTGAGPGSANIFAKAGSAESTGFAVTVNAQVHFVSVTPNPAFLSFGGEQQFTATAQDANHNPIAGAPAATWKSSNSTFVSIDSGGLATNHVSGIPANVTITATIAGIDGTAEVSAAGY